MDRELLLPLETVLPPGRLIRSDEGRDALYPLWLSDAPVTAALWQRIYTEHPRTGLWPLILDSTQHWGGDFRPWGSGELFPRRMTSPAIHDPAELLRNWWTDYTAVDEEDDMLTPEARIAVTAPFGRSWPGLVVIPASTGNTDAMANGFAEHFIAAHPRARLGLVAGRSGAEALAASGWNGPANYDNDTAKFAAVVETWEHRFGARVIAVGPSTLHLSVAAPPTTADQALRVAAEHFAFCPDNVWQGRQPYTLASYAEHLPDSNCWEFWWD